MATTAVMSPGLGWDAKEVTDSVLSALRETADIFITKEGFSSLIATRHESLKGDLTKMVFKLKGAQDVLLGAKGVDNFSLYKTTGDFQGSVVIFKDKMVFISSLAYKLQKAAEYYKPEEKIAEMNKILSDLRARAEDAGFTFAGTLDSFSVTRAGSFSGGGAVHFLADAKASLSGLKLRAL